MGGSFKNPLLYLNRTKSLQLIYEYLVENKCYDTKIYSAASSELFGDVSENGATVNNKFYFLSPYAVSMANCLNLSEFYRQNYKLKIVNGFTFNHESKIRNDNFFMNSLIVQAKLVKSGRKEFIELGNLNNIRDFGFAGEYAQLIYDYMKKDVLEDFVLGTGTPLALIDVVEIVLNYLDLDYDNVRINDSLQRKCDIQYSVANKDAVFKHFGKLPELEGKKLIEFLIDDFS